MSSRMPARIATACAAGTVAAIAAAGPAAAHTEIELSDLRAGAGNVTLTMTAEAESDAAGIAAVRVVTPDGIAPGQVALVEGPPGWTLTPAADGFTAAGQALRARTDARLVLRIAQLPPTPGVLAFKTVVTYTDGSADRWIEPPSAQNPNPAHPAPTVSLLAAAPAGDDPAGKSAGAGSPSVVPAATTPAVEVPVAPSAAARTDDPASRPVGWLVGAAALLVAAAGGGFLLVRHRRRAPVAG